MRRAPHTVVTVCVLAWGCLPDTGGGSDDATVIIGQGGSGGRGGDGGLLPIGDGGGGADGGGTGGMGGQGMGGMGGAGGEGGCEPGDQRCLEEGQPAYQRCNIDREWALERCPDGELCFDEECLPDPANCEAGETICIDGQRPAECDPEEGWVEGEPCAADQRCVDGACSAVACAEAAAQRSYLGCDYVAVDLPNAALVAGDQGTTPNAPVGVVLANPDFGASAHVTVIDPMGGIAGLVPQRNVPVPPIPEVQMLYQPQTVRSEVRDGAGQVVDQNVERADALEIPPGGIATLLLPRVAAHEVNSSVRRVAFRITTDRPVAAYQFSPYCCNYSFSNDASLLFPTSALGLDYRYLGVPSWQQPLAPPGSGSPAGIAIVGTVDGTEITVELPQAGLLNPDDTGRLGINGRRVTVRIDAQEVVQLNARNGDPFMDLDPDTFQIREPDLSGSVITATEPVAVFSTHMCTYYPQALAACDHVEEQLFPTGTWGNTFTLVPPVRRGQGVGGQEFIYWKIIARDPGTRVTLSTPFGQIGPQPPGFVGVPYCGDHLAGQDIVLDNPQFCEFGTSAPVQITGDGPLMVMGIVSGQESTGLGQPFGAQAGDPAIFLVPPDRQYRQDYPFLTPATYAHDFLTIVADPDAQILLDDAAINLGDATPVPGTNRVFKHIEIADGQHRVAGNRPFGILVFAFDDFVSYAFTGGLNLEKR